MSGIQLRPFVDPDLLADALDLWALRREKVLRLLDIRGARAARVLAHHCRLLAQPGYEAIIGAEDWQDEWQAIRSDALSMLSPTNGTKEVSRSGRRIPTPAHLPAEYEYEALARAVEWNEQVTSKSDRPTPVERPAWPFDPKASGRR